MARNDGKQFEELLHELYTALLSNERYTSVEKNVQLDGHDGPRQIDVLIKSQVAGMPLLTVVECRDFNKRLDVTAIDAFQSKLVDVRANKGVLVSRKGFSKTATQKAKRVGITLCVASNANEILSTLGMQIPVVITEVGVFLQGINGTLHLSAGTAFRNEDIGIINDQYFTEVFRNEVLQGVFKFPVATGTIPWTPTLIQPPFYIRDISGTQHFFDQVEFAATLSVSYYFGHINDLPEAIAVHNQADELIHVFIKSEDIPVAKDRLSKYHDPGMIPKVNAIQIFAIALPTVDSSAFTFQNRITGESFSVSRQTNPS